MQVCGDGGVQTLAAAEQLQAAGYSNVVLLAGGYTAWAAVSEAWEGVQLMVL